MQTFVLSVVCFNGLLPLFFEAVCVSAVSLHGDSLPLAVLAVVKKGYRLRNEISSQTFRLPGNSSDTSNPVWTFLFVFFNLCFQLHCDSLFLPSHTCEVFFSSTLFVNCSQVSFCLCTFSFCIPFFHAVVYLLHSYTISRWICLCLFFC